MCRSNGSCVTRLALASMGCLLPASVGFQALEAASRWRWQAASMCQTLWLVDSGQAEPVDG